MPSLLARWTYRSPTFAWLMGAVACIVAVTAFGLLVSHDRAPLGSFDHLGLRAEGWANQHALLMSFLRGVEVAFATVGMCLWTTVVVVILLVRRRVRSAVFAIVVMVATSLLTTLMKLWFGRGRPGWQVQADKLTSKSFPSGHASSSAALAGVLIVLAIGLVTYAALRQALIALALVMWVVVCLDRVFLGRHYPTDVIAGSFLGVAVVIVATLLIDPVRHGRLQDEVPVHPADQVSTGR
jgi:membrane-associated phospholipid phosphatase